jgi:hypothetical protein
LYQTLEPKTCTEWQSGAQKTGGRIRIIFSLFVTVQLIGAAVYGRYTGNWENFVGVLPFAVVGVVMVTLFCLTENKAKFGPWLHRHPKLMFMLVGSLGYVPFPITTFLIVNMRHGWLLATTSALVVTGFCLVPIVLFYLALNKLFSKYKSRY